MDEDLLIPPGSPPDLFPESDRRTGGGGFLPTAAEAAELPPVEPPPLPPDYVSEAPVVAPPAGDFGFADFGAPPAPVPEARFGLPDIISPPPPPVETLPAPALTDLQMASGELQFRGQRLDTLAGDIASNRSRAAELRAEFATATPERQAEILGQLAQVGGEVERKRFEQQKLREESTDLATVAETALAAKAADLRAAQLRAADAAVAKSKAEFDRKREAEENARRLAVVRMNEDREAYRAAASKTPEIDSFAIMGIITESFSAGLEKRQPYYGSIIKAASERARAKANDRIDSTLRLYNLSRDDVAARDIARSELDAMERAAAADIFERAEQQLRKDMDAAAEPLRKAQLAQQVDAVRQEREARQAAAIDARLEADRKLAAADLDLELKRATIGKEQAAAAKTAAEADRLQRRGTGGKPSARPGLLAPNVVTFPDSDVPLVDFPNTPEGRKEAAVVRGLVASQAKALDRINGVIALYEDADKRGVLESSGWERTGDYANLDTQLAFLRTDLALVKSGGLATTEGDDKWAGGLVPSSPKAWTSKRKALAELNALRQTIENEARNQLSGKTRLDKPTRERVIGASRPKSVSRSDLAERERKQASRDLVSPTTSSDRKVTAVGQIETEARQRAKDEGDEKDWLPRATAELSAALSDPNVFNDKRVAGAIRDKLREYEKFALERVDSETPAAMTRSLTTSVGAAPGSERHRTAGQLDEAAIERHAAIAERARVAALKLDIREASPAQRQVMRRFPGMSPLVDEVEIEEAAISTPKTGEEK